MRDTLGTFTVTHVVNMGRKPVSQITDRAKRYRAQSDVEGPQRCVICGAANKNKNGRPLDVMHLSGDESDGDKRNLAYGCRTCNAKLSAAFKALGSKVRTRQYNGSGWEIGGPALGRGYQRQQKVVAQIDAINEKLRDAKGLNQIVALLKRRSALAAKAAAWDQGSVGNPAVKGVPTFQQYAWGVANHERGAHDEGGAVIHATPRHKRIEYARRIAETRRQRRDSVPF